MAGEDDKNKNDSENLDTEEEFKRYQQWRATQGGGQVTGIDGFYPARIVYATSEQIKQYNPNYFIQTPGGLAYRGEYLVDENNRISRMPYSPDEVSREFLNASLADRTRLLNTLVSYDMYSGNARPSALAMEGKGMTDDDIRAMSRFLSQAVTAGRTWKAFLPILEGTVRPAITGSGGARISFDDAAAIYREESFRTLGRAPTADETRRAVRFMQSSDANPSVAAEKQAGMISPDESTAKLVGDGISRMMALL